METASLTIMIDKDGKEIAVLYTPFYGSLSEHGRELKSLLYGAREVDCVIPDMKENDFHGMECLAASVVAHFKDGVGEFYLYPNGTRNLDEEYRYYLSQVNQRIVLMIDKLCSNNDSFESKRWKTIFYNYLDEFNLTTLLEELEG